MKMGVKWFGEYQPSLELIRSTGAVSIYLANGRRPVCLNWVQRRLKLVTNNPTLKFVIMEDLRF